jgi:hypothetical protein
LVALRSVFNQFTVTKKVVSVFVRFRAASPNTTVCKTCV